VAVLDRVIVIAGPSCVGKSTLIDALRRGEHPRLAAALGLHDPKAWVFQNARRTARAAIETAARNLVLHYDIVRPAMEPSIAGYADDPGLAPMLEARELCVCTIWGKGDLLRARAAFKSRRRARIDSTALHSPRQWWLRNRRMSTLRSWYRNDVFVLGLYDQWFAFVGSVSPGARQLIVNALEPESIATPIAHWRASRSDHEESRRTAGGSLGPR